MKRDESKSATPASRYPRPVGVLFYVVAVGALSLFTLMMGFLFQAGADFFFGDKEPVFELALGLILGIMIAVKLGEKVFELAREGETRRAWAILFAIIAFDVAAIPVGILLMAFANR